MQTSLYRKTVMKTVHPKRAKLGLKVIAKSTHKTNLAMATVGLNTELGVLMRELTPYILGLQLTPEMKANAYEAFGGVGYYLTILCRLLKVSTPAATKKARLTGTRTSALMQFNSLATDLLSLFGDVFTGPKMVPVEKLVVLPKLGGIKEVRTVLTLDKDAEVAAEAKRNDQMKGITAAAVDLYWRLSFDMFGKAPASIFDFNAAQLKTKFFEEPTRRTAAKPTRISKVAKAAPVPAPVVKKATPVKVAAKKIVPIVKQVAKKATKAAKPFKAAKAYKPTPSSKVAKLAKKAKKVKK